jgi:hypothetical protein
LLISLTFGSIQSGFRTRVHAGQCGAPPYMKESMSWIDSRNGALSTRWIVRRARDYAACGLGRSRVADRRWA